MKKYIKKYKNFIIAGAMTSIIAHGMFLLLSLIFVFPTEVLIYILAISEGIIAGAIIGGILLTDEVFELSGSFTFFGGEENQNKVEGFGWGYLTVFFLFFMVWSPLIEKPESLINESMINEVSTLFLVGIVPVGMGLLSGIFSLVGLVILLLILQGINMTWKLFQRGSSYYNRH